MIISSPKGFAHQGLAMKVEGSARLQVSAKSAGLFDAFYNTVPPMELVCLHIPVASPGKVPFGITKFPFEFELLGSDGQPLFETYHGVYVSVKYEIVCDCVRGIMKTNLHKTIEFIVEVPVRDQRDSGKTSTGKRLMRQRVSFACISCKSRSRTRQKSSTSRLTRSRMCGGYVHTGGWLSASGSHCLGGVDLAAGQQVTDCRR